MTLSIQPITPVFVGEVSGVDITRPLSRDEVAAIEAGMDRYAVLVFHDQHLTDEQQMRLHPQLRRARGLARRQHHDSRTSAGCRSACRTSPTSTRTSKPLARDDRRRMFNLGNRLWHSDSSFRAIPAKYSLLSGRIVVAARRQHRIRRHARRLRRARRRDQGGDRGPGLRAFADLLARLARLHRTDARRSGRCSSRCASAWCARIR